MTPETNPADERYELDLCIQEINSLKAERDALQSEVNEMSREINIKSSELELRDRDVCRKQNWIDGISGKIHDIAVKLGIDCNNSESFYQLQETEKRIDTLQSQLAAMQSDIQIVLSEKWCLYEDFKLMTRLNLLETYEPANRLMEIVEAAKKGVGA